MMLEVAGATLRWSGARLAGSELWTRPFWSTPMTCSRASLAVTSRHNWGGGFRVAYLIDPTGCSGMWLSGGRPSRTISSVPHDLPTRGSRPLRSASYRRLEDGSIGGCGLAKHRRV